MPPFYELQLIIFAAICLIWLLLDRQLSNKRTSDHGSSMLGGAATAMSRLAKQYLIVYAIVMGEYAPYIFGFVAY